MEHQFTIRVTVNEEDARNEAEYYRYSRDITALLQGEILSHLHSLDYVEEVTVKQGE